MENEMTPRQKWINRWYAAAADWNSKNPKPHILDPRRWTWKENKEQFRQEWQVANPSPPRTASEQIESDKARRLNDLMTGTGSR